MAHDAARRRTVLFGGDDGAPNGDTWEFDGTTWNLRATTGPSPRAEHALAFDAARGVVVLFGGESGGARNDTWLWNGSRWNRVTPSVSPSPRAGHAMAYDAARQVTVLFGGSGLRDTWEWNGSNWSRVQTSGPSGRSDHAMAYDQKRGRTVLYGGYTPPRPHADTWEWNGTAWLLRSAISLPGARSSHTMSYDTRRGCTVIHGGSSTAGTLADSWEWDGTSWRRVARTTPPGRFDAAAAYDSSSGRVLMHGGSNGPPLGDLWTYATSSPALATGFGMGCSGSAGVPRLDPVPHFLPWLGGSFAARLTNLPNSASFAWILGTSNTTWAGRSLPLPLASIGMPGCSLWASPDLVRAGFSPNGSSRWSLAIPVNPWLDGQHLYVQAFAIDPGANALGITSSNAIDARIGTK